MALSIKNAEAERLARELARERGTTVPRAVVGALDDALRRTRGRRIAPSIRMRFSRSRTAAPRCPTSTQDRPTRFSDTTTAGASADGRRFVRRARHPLRRTGVRTLRRTSLNRISKCFRVFVNPRCPVSRPRPTPVARQSSLQKRGDQRAGLDVPHSSGFHGRMRQLGSTLRHVRRQSVRRQFPPEARGPATLLSGHRLRVVGE